MANGDNGYYTITLPEGSPVCGRNIRELEEEFLAYVERVGTLGHCFNLFAATKDSEGARPDVIPEDATCLCVQSLRHDADMLRSYANSGAED